MSAVLAAVSLGSNVGDREGYLRLAREGLSAMPSTRIVRESSIRETEPVDVPDEFSGMKFLNQAVLLETELDVHEFSRLMHGIEDSLGRERTVRNGPRTIDLDLIFFGQETLDEPEITLPHPRAKSREFVLQPLREILGSRPWASLLRLPNIGTSFGDAIAGAVMAGVSLGTIGRFSPSMQGLTGGGVLFWSGEFGWREVGLSAISVAALYVFGLVDNDIVDKKEDEMKSPLRPLALGVITLKRARIVRALFIAVAAVAAFFAVRPEKAGWWVLAFPALALIIASYNRLKSLSPLLGVALMGLCRGGAVLVGGLAASGGRLTPPLLAMAAGWSLYISAVTLLGLREEEASKPLGGFRFLGALAALAPLSAFGLIASSGVASTSEAIHLAAIPAVGAMAAAAAWICAVSPLGSSHCPQARRMAVGQTIGAIAYLQVGFILACPIPAAVISAVFVWFASRFARRLSSRLMYGITGS